MEIKERPRTDIYQDTIKHIN